MRRVLRYVTVLATALATLAAIVVFGPTAHALLPVGAPSHQHAREAQATRADAAGTQSAGNPLAPSAAKVLAGPTPGNATGPLRRPIGGIAASTVGTLRDKIRTTVYWTTRRMRGARPVALDPHDRRAGGLGDLSALSLLPLAPAAPTPPKAPPQRAQQASQPSHAPARAGASGGAFSWPGGGAITRTTGKVFFTLAGSDYVCSASAVRSANRDTVVTAGHCVNSGPGEFASHWIFVPAYRDGYRPFGTWTARRLFAPTAWTERGDIDHDVGFAVLDTYEGQHLGDVVGGQPIAFNAPRGQYSYSFGYPALGQYDGDSLFFCRGRAKADRYGSGDQGLQCDMTDGSSGGPWLSRFDPATGTGILTSVNSFGYDGMPDVMWGPYFDDTIRGVYATAQRS